MDVRWNTMELIATLERSSLATILVEGVDDMRRYRWIEDAIPGDVNVLQAGGRESLLAVYAQRNRFHIPIAFVADKDLWLFSGVPSDYQGVVFTTGFSIENDILDSDIVMKLFSPKERSILSKLEDELSQWYAYEISLYLKKKEYKLDYHIRRLINELTLRFDSASILPREFVNPPFTLKKSIREEFARKYRGKNLLELYEFVFQRRNRMEDGVRHSREALIEMSAKCGSCEVIDNLILNIRRALELTGYCTGQ